MRARVLLGVGLVVAAVACLPASNAGAKGKLTTKTFSSGPINKPLPDAVGIFTEYVAAPIRVKAWGKVKDVNIALRITHPDTAELSVLATNPQQKQSTLAERLQGPGANGDNFGAGAAGCQGSLFTTFDDSAATSILQGTNPYAGSFTPQTPLRALNRGQLHGRWDIEVGDFDPGDVGVINCWELTVRYKPQQPPRKCTSPGCRPPKGIKGSTG